MSDKHCRLARSHAFDEHIETNRFAKIRVDSKRQGEAVDHDIPGRTCHDEFGDCCALRHESNHGVAVDTVTNSDVEILVDEWLEFDLT